MVSNRTQLREVEEMLAGAWQAIDRMAAVIAATDPGMLWKIEAVLDAEYRQAVDSGDAADQNRCFYAFKDVQRYIKAHLHTPDDE